MVRALLGTGQEVTPDDRHLIIDPVVLDRVVGPEDGPRPRSRDGLALVLLELAADPLVLRVHADSEHVGPVDDLSVAHAGDAEDEAEQLIPLAESACRDATELLGDEHETGGHGLAEVAPPGGVLEFDAGEVLGV